jgi:TolB-like protein/class 3 adenylate cyclase
MVDQEVTRKLTAILSADVAGYSRMMGEDEQTTVRMLNEYRKVFVHLINQCKGRVVDTAGDNVLAVFGSVVEAVRCAVDVQRDLETRNGTLPEANRMRFRIGINLGDVIEQTDGSIYGDGINVAARIQSLAKLGGICISGTVYDQIENKLPLGYEYMGQPPLKNIKQSVRVYQVLSKSEATSTPVIQTKQRGFKAWRKVMLAIVAILLLGGGVVIWKSYLRFLSPPMTAQSNPVPASTSETLSLDKKRIAILPFVNLSADAENEYFVDGMTEEMISQLSKISDLEVIARTSVMTYKGATKKVADIGQELKVGTVLEGSVRKAVNKLRVTVQLINVENQAHLWTQDYDRELKDVFAIQSDIAQKVTEALKVKLLAEEKQKLEKKATENVEAYTLYLKGRYFMNKFTPEGLKKGIEYFEQAIENDPVYALAYDGLSDSYTLLGWWGYRPPKEVFPKARAAAEKALEIDDTLAEPHNSLAMVKMVYDWDWLGAEREFKRSIELNPKYPKAHHVYGLYLACRGQFAKAIEEEKQAQKLDPLSTTMNTGVGMVFYLARQYDQAIEELRKTLEIDPNFLLALEWLGYAYIKKGMYEEAIAVFQQERDVLGDDPLGLSDLGYGYAVSGKRVEALKALNALKERSNQEHIEPFYIAWVYAGLGEKDPALEWLQKAYEERSSSLVYLIDPGFDSIRLDPRFTELVRKVGLPME